MDTAAFIEYVSLVFIQDGVMKFSTTTQGYNNEKPLSVPSEETYYIALEICQELPISRQGKVNKFIHQHTALRSEVEPRAEAFFSQVTGPCYIILRTGDPGNWQQYKAAPMSLCNTLVIFIDQEIRIPKGKYEMLMIVPCEINFYFTNDEGADRIVDIQRKDWNFRFWVQGS